MSFPTRVSMSAFSRPISRRRLGALAFGTSVAFAVGGASIPAVSAQSSPVASPEASPPSSSVTGATDLTALLPAADAAPLGLDKSEDTTNDKAAALLALTSAVTAGDLDSWGWQGSVTRVYTASDPSKLEKGDTSSEIATVDGFSAVDGASNAFPAYSDALVAGGYKILDNAPLYGDQAHLLWSKDETSGASDAALVIQKDMIVYTIVTKAEDGSPIFDVERTAVGMGLRRS